MGAKQGSHPERRIVAVMLVLLLVGCAPGGIRPEPDGMLRRISLDGDWRFMPAALQPADRFDPSLDDRDWPIIRVPSNWYLEGRDMGGAAWYRRHFAADADLDGRLLRLLFEGIDYAADVWLNGVYLGFHEGYFQPFGFDVSKLVKPGEDNVLVVRVDSPYEDPSSAWSLRKRLIKGIFSHHDTRPGGAWSSRGQEKNTGGIWGGVHLAVSDTVAIDTVKITPRVDAATGNAQAEVLMRLVHAGDWPASFELELGLIPANFAGRSTRTIRSVHLPPGQAELRFTLDAPEARLWWPVGHGEPNLYRLDLAVRKGGDLLDRDEQVFGFRSVGFDPESQIWTINGKRIFLRGTNYIPTQWLAGMKREDYLRDADLMREAHINVIRVHAHVGAEAFYRVCDEKGLLVWQDFPLQWGYADTPELHETARQQAGEMVATLFNHPAIIAWSLHNEPPWDADWMKYKYPDYNPNQNRVLDDILYRTVLAADPSRHVHKHSSTGEHQWIGWYFGHWTDFAKPTKQKIISEYGAQALPGLPSLRKIFSEAELWPDTAKEWEKWEYHNFQRKETFDNAKVPMGKNIQEFIRNTQGFQARLIQLAAESYRRQKYRPVTGIFQFMFVEDWPSINWGVVDYWREPKPGYQALKTAYQPVLPSIEWPREVFRTGEPVRFGLWAINDRWESYPEARLSYAVNGGLGQVAPPKTTMITLEPDSAFKVMDTETLKLAPGVYELVTRIETREGTELGTNRFEFRVIGSRARRRS
jgi:beta-mannosidase